MKKSEFVALVADGNVRVAAEMVGVGYQVFLQWPEDLPQDKCDRICGAARRHGVRLPQNWLGEPSPYLWRNKDMYFYFYRRGLMRAKNGRIPRMIRRVYEKRVYGQPVIALKERLALKEREKGKKIGYAAINLEPSPPCRNRDEVSQFRTRKEARRDVVLPKKPRPK